MVIFIKIIIKALLIFLTFFVYDIENIDSNSDKILLYDSVNIHDENNFTLYFKNKVNSYDLDLLKKYDVFINSYIISDKKYYAKDGNDLINIYTKNKTLEEKIYYKIKGINIDGINITCENSEIIKLLSIYDVY